MHRWHFLFIVVAGIFLAGSITFTQAQDGPTATPTAKQSSVPSFDIAGSFTVDRQDFTIKPTQTEKNELAITIWYPTSVKSAATTAPVTPSSRIKGPYPLVIFSPALRVSPEDYLLLRSILPPGVSSF